MVSLVMSKATQDSVMRTCATTASILSIAGSIYIIGRYWIVRRNHTKKTAVNATNELIHILAWFDLFISFGHVASIYPAHTYHAKLGEPVTTICKVQAFDIMFNDLTVTFWNFFIALNLFRWVCYGDDQIALHRRIPYYLAITLFMALSITTAGLFDHAYGDAGLWCWVSIPGNKTKDILWKYGGLFGWLGAVMGFMVFSLVRVRQNVRERIYGEMSEEAKAAYLRVVRSQVYVIIGFIICWMPGFSHRTLAVLLDKPAVYPLNVIQSITCPLQGLMHAIIFGHFHQWIVSKLQGADGFVYRSGLASNFTALIDVEEREDRKFAATKVSLFLTTLDLQWGTLNASNLAKWIPAGSDIYVISLIHCADVRPVEECLGRHLVKINQPVAYRSITSLASARKQGDAQLCQFVFVNTAELEAGNLRYDARDVRLWSQGRALQQAVSATLRYFDTTFAIVSCNTDSGAEIEVAAEPGSEVETSRTSESSVRHARALGLNLALCHHTFQLGRMQHATDIVLHSVASMRDDVQQQRSWVHAIGADSEWTAVCHAVEFEVNRVFAVAMV